MALIESVLLAVIALISFVSLLILIGIFVVVYLIYKRFRRRRAELPKMDEDTMELAATMPSPSASSSETDLTAVIAAMKSRHQARIDSTSKSADTSSIVTALLYRKQLTISSLESIEAEDKQIQTEIALPVHNPTQDIVIIDIQNNK